MNSLWSTISELVQVTRDYAQSFTGWAEQHAGLGGWVGAIGAMLAIFLTWGLARAEYRRDERRAHARKNTEIDLLKKIASEFNALMDIYFAAIGGDSLADTFYQRHMNDPKFHSMSDLAHIPVTQWPSIESYVSFKNYWFWSIKDLEEPLIDTQLASFKLANHRIRFDDFMKALDVARR
jgi:hypothetical protein